MTHLDTDSLFLTKVILFNLPNHDDRLPVNVLKKRFRTGSKVAAAIRNAARGIIGKDVFIENQAARGGIEIYLSTVEPRKEGNLELPLDYPPDRVSEKLTWVVKETDRILKCISKSPSPDRMHVVEGSEYTESETLITHPNRFVVALVRDIRLAGGHRPDTVRVEIGRSSWDIRIPRVRTVRLPPDGSETRIGRVISFSWPANIFKIDGLKQPIRWEKGQEAAAKAATWALATGSMIKVRIEAVREMKAGEVITKHWCLAELFERERPLYRDE